MLSVGIRVKRWITVCEAWTAASGQGTGIIVWKMALSSLSVASIISLSTCSSSKTCFFERNMTTEVQTRLHPMMPIRLVACAAIATTLLARTVFGGDSVIVELKSGRRIRAHSIAQDASHPDEVTLKIGNAQIQMERSIPWQRIDRMSASADQRAELRIPESVKVVDDFEDRTALLPVPLLTSTVAPLSPEHSSLVPTQRGWNSSWNLPGGCDLLGCAVSYDPGVVVGVRDFSCSPAPFSGLRPNCCRFPIEP
ncbi:MAG: hypothetical protein JWP89_6778 [Schlesneria sp.]|nr:hypothetical protein [Schlesneria sp.]